MAPRRPKRLPTDFFDRLLSNQTDDQINDLLTSLVDEQISPTAEPTEKTAPLAVEPHRPKTIRRGFHRDKIEDSIITRDEELDEEPLTGDQESALDELIPRTSQMQSALGNKPAPQETSPPAAEKTIEQEAPPLYEQPAEPQAGPGKIKFPGSDNLEVPQELIAEEEKAPADYSSVPTIEVPEVPAPPSEESVSQVISTPPSAMPEASEGWQVEMPVPPDVPLPPEVPPPPEVDASLSSVSEAPPAAPAMDTVADFDVPAKEKVESADVSAELPPSPAGPEIPAEEPQAPSVPLPSHEELIRSRIRARWERPKRKPKLPKLAKPSKPVTIAPPKPDKISDILGDLAKAEPTFHFTKLHRAALMFLLPAFIAFSLFSWYPMIKGLLISFYDYHPTGVTTFIGFQNYARAFQDEMFWKTILHAGGFCISVLLLGFWLPILISIFINELRFGKGLLKFLFFLPFLMPTVPAAILWKWIMDQGFGLLNALLTFLPLADPHIGWLTNPKLALLSIVLVYIWKNTGWAILIYSAALGNIDETLYEEAEMDGATLWDKIKHVTYPALRGVIAVMLIITIINTLQLFTEVYIMTNGGPMNATEVIATYIYKQAFFYMDIGYASALSILLLMMLLVITTFRLRRLDPEGG